MAAANESSASAGLPESSSNPPMETPATTPETGIQTENSAPPAAREVGPSETGIQAQTPAAAKPDVIPLPPLKVKRAPLTPERLAAEIKFLDRIIVGLVLVLAFLLGSFAIQNSDFWMHLATGRLIAQGEYSFGENPFSHPETGYWANHAWLFDALSYGLAAVGGGIEASPGQALLVIFRALIFVGLAWVLLSIRRPGQSLWMPAVCTALAILTVSTGLSFQPSFVSYLFLAITLYLLTRAGSKAATVDTRSQGIIGFFQSRPVWLLPLLFVLWVNLDSWFILGPLAVGLFLLGEVVQKYFAPIPEGPDARLPTHLGTLSAVFVVGLFACLVSPFHYHALTVPTNLSYLLVLARDGVENLVGIAIPLPDQLLAGGQTLQTLNAQDAFTFPTPLSPFVPEYFQEGYDILTVAGLGYYLLLATGIVSFILLAWSGAIWVWGRFFVWLGFALLSCAAAPLIPFFAVVAGPITALNIQDLMARAFGTQVRVDGFWKGWSLGARLATVGGGLLLVAMAWPGWLHGHADDPTQSRHVAWHVQPDQTLRAMARQLNQVLDQSKPACAFNFNLNIPAYCAWYCPQEKTFMDRRLALFGDRAQDFITARDGLIKDWSMFTDRASEYFQARRESPKNWAPENPLPDRPEPLPQWQEIFQSSQINHVLHSNLSVLQEVWVNPKQWVQPDAGDITFIAGWKGAKGGVPFSVAPLNIDALAFNPGRANRLPDEGPSDEPAEPGWATSFRQGPAPIPWDVHAAEMYLTYHNIHAQFWPFLHEKWMSPRVQGIRLGFLLAPMGSTTGGLSFPPTLRITRQLPDWYLMAWFLNAPLPPAPLVLAVRAARQAVAAQPQNPEAHFLLAKASYALWKGQEDRWGRRLRGNELSFRTMEGQLRQTQRLVQVVTALNNALALKPSLVDAHMMLKEIYLQIHYWDTALHHWEEALRYRQEQVLTRYRSETAEDFQKRNELAHNDLKEMRKQVRGLRREVDRRTKDFRLASADKRLQDKVMLAVLLEYTVEGQGRPDPMGRGLASRALDLLLKAKSREIAGMGGMAAMWQIRLLLTLGRAKEARERLDTLRPQVERMKKDFKSKGKANPGLEQALHQLDFWLPWYESVLESAGGNYQEANRQLAKLRSMAATDFRHLKRPALSALQDLFLSFRLQDAKGIAMPGAQTASLQVLNWSLLVGDRPLIQTAFGLIPWLRNGAAMDKMYRVAQALKIEAELDLISGLLALEQGDINTAARFFRHCVLRSRHLQYGPNAFRDRIIAVKYLEEIDRQKNKANR